MSYGGEERQRDRETQQLIVPGFPQGGLVEGVMSGWGLREGLDGVMSSARLVEVPR